MPLPSIGMFLGGIGALLGKVSTYIPGRVEKLKNELATLQKEKFNLLQGVCNEKKADRLLAIDKRIDAINGLLGAKASD